VSEEKLKIDPVKKTAATRVDMLLQHMSICCCNTCQYVATRGNLMQLVSRNLRQLASSDTNWKAILVRT